MYTGTVGINCNFLISAAKALQDMESTEPGYILRPVYGSATQVRGSEFSGI